MKRIALFLLCPFMTWAMEQRLNERKKENTPKVMKASTEFMNVNKIDQLAHLEGAAAEFVLHVCKLKPYCTPPTFMQELGVCQMCLGGVCGLKGMTVLAVLCCLRGGCEIYLGCREKSRREKEEKSRAKLFKDGAEIASWPHPN